jgi:translation initiation factor 5B
MSESIDDLLNDINTASTKKGGKKKGGAAQAKKPEPIKEEIEVKTEVITTEEPKKFDNDDLLNELESMPSKKGKKKAPAKSNVKQEPEPKVEEKPVDNTTNDDLLNELSSMPSKKKGKGKQPAKEEKQPEPPKEEINQPKPEEQPAEEANEEDKEETEEKPEKGGEKKPKKKVVKKVVKKQTKEDKFLKLLQEQAKKKKELEEKLQREAEEEERRIKEEEERQRKIEEERKRQEEMDKEKELERLELLRSRGIKAADLKKLDQKKQQTEDELKKQGFAGGIDEFLKSIPNKIPMKKKPAKKPQPKISTEQKEEEEYVPKDEEPIKEQKEIIEKPNEELLKHTEKDISIKINTDNDDLDWEDFDENKVEEKPKKETKPKEKEEIETIKLDIDKEITTTAIDNKKQRTKPKEKKAAVDEEPEYIPKAKLRAPIICILGHVDTGKTKILDKLRKTNVQEGEAGGITQQIGATFFPIENFTHHLNKIPEKFRIDPKIPGFLVIDTPGHESFQNLRVRGSSLCDLAVLVVDIMHGLEKQTIDSIELLRRRKTPFIIALNKVDRIYQWKSTEWGGFRDSYEVQKKNQTREFNDRLNKIIMQLVQNNLNVALYDENPSMKEYINIVPTSAVTGEGMPDLIGMFVYIGQKFLMKKIEYKEEIQCTILEVKVLEGTGTTIDVILVNGTLKVGDKIIIGGLFGPIKTSIKILLTPHPMKEMRIKSEYLHHESISGAIGVKIFATDLDNSLAGSPLYVYKSEEEAENYAGEITQDFNSIIRDYLSKTGKGIMVQASTLGSLEAILTYLHEKKIEIAAVGLGNLHKKDVIKLKTIHSNEENPLKEYLTILAFDIKVSQDLQQFSEENDIKIFSADVIYHLFDSYVHYSQQCKEERKKQKEREAVFPCMLKIVPNAVFNRKDPIIIGVDVIEGILKVGTPLIVLDKKLPLGTVEGIESNKKPTNNVRPKDGSVAIRIKPSDASLTVGRQFEETDVIASHVIYYFIKYFRFLEIQ